MINNTSPLESLAAFAIAFAAGVVSTAALGIYTHYLRKPPVVVASVDD